MRKELADFSFLPKLASESEKGRTFKLVWILDIDTTPSKHLVRLLFQNVKSNFYIVDCIPPELLSYCTIGSFFKEGRKLDHQPNGSVLTFTISSTNHNEILEASKVLTDTEYNLNNRWANFCKHQKCLVFRDDTMKYIIPCSVIAGHYYFKSTSMREQVFAQRLEGLYEEISIDPTTRHATIIMKPGACNEDAKSIVRAAKDPFAEKRWDMIMNHFRAARGNHCSIKADFPVVQDIVISARGHITNTPDGGKTFIVFEILGEDSRFPFNSIEVQRREHDSSGETNILPAKNVNPSSKITNESPIAEFVRIHVTNRFRSINSHETEMPETYKSINPKPNNDGYGVRTEGNKETVDISFMHPEPGHLQQGIAKGELTQKTGNDSETGYKMPLGKFIEMASTITGYEGVSDFTLSEDLVWHKTRAKGNGLTLKESYDHTAKNMRRCACIWFRYDGSNVCLVEIDQTGLPGKGSSTFVLVSQMTISKDTARGMVKSFVAGQNLQEKAKRLLSQNIHLKKKHHPQSDDENNRKAWWARLLKIVTDIQEKDNCIGLS
ncbi:MAG: hypothetical protein CXR31_11745 [Geobacter sp.]|nr:MAG: hypothetical protein CXR31_11745 [Geobacter sp.]